MNTPLTETSTLRDGTTVTRIRENESQQWSEWIFSDGYKCFTDKRTTALGWHRNWIKKQQNQ